MGTEHVVPAVLSRWGRRAANQKKGVFYPMPKRGVVRRVWRESCRRGTPRLREKAHVTSRTSS